MVIKRIKGYTLIEILIVMSSFAILAVLVTMTVAYSLRGSRKSESSSDVRSEMEYAVGIMERQLRNSNSITQCVNGSVSYEDENGVIASFSCVSETSGDLNYTYIASSSASLGYSIPLTSNKLDLTCQFSCQTVSDKPYVPTSVNISLTGVATSVQGVEGAKVTLETEVLLRNY